MPPRRSPNLERCLDTLEEHYGPQERPPPRKALDWVLWENAAYLVPDERRKAAYLALKKKTGLRAEGILALSREALRELAALGGMMPERRVEKWIAIAEEVRDEWGGQLESALKLPIARARRGLRRFPGIGAPGADKILLFTGTHAVPALESAGLRALVRSMGIEEAKSYSTTYRAAMSVLEPLASQGCAGWVRAFSLLRRHGQTLCKDKGPACDECPLAETCPAAS